MKRHLKDLSLGKYQNVKIVFLLGIGIGIILFTIGPIAYTRFPKKISFQLPSLDAKVNEYSTSVGSKDGDVIEDSTSLASKDVIKNSTSLGSKDGEVMEESTSVGSNGKCDIFVGEWIPDSNAPYYTNETCWAIHEHQNCMKYGRPDMDFLKWKWKPDGCELPIFDPNQFLELVRGKTLAFIGDSVGRNHMQSLICLLSKVESPVQVAKSEKKKYIRWKYRNHNFTIEGFWSPFLVKAREVDSKDPALASLCDVYLDKIDKSWTTKMEKFDYVIIASGHWFFRPLIYYENGQVLGCHKCVDKNMTVVQRNYAYRKTVQTVFRAINNAKNFKGIAFLRTFAPSHFEGGLWDMGGNCVRTSPFTRNETRLDGSNLELYMIQQEEFRVAEREGKEKGRKFRLLDTTKSTLMRPDGHPSRYGHWPNENITWSDCLHWCLPGPIDTWNNLLLEMLKRE
ncbi:hypothetical protein ACHQM5_006605 [Ranunculus cassubicifolius]